MSRELFIPISIFPLEGEEVEQIQADEPYSINRSDGLLNFEPGTFNRRGTCVYAAADSAICAIAVASALR